MMRRSRISVKPNFRPGSRTGAEGERLSQGVKEAGETLPAIKAEEVAGPAASHQQNITLKDSSEDVGIKDAAEVSSNMSQNDGAPSSGATTSSTAPNRRMRISAAPKLVAPKITSTHRPRPSASLPSSAPSSQSNEEQVKIHASASEAQGSFTVTSNDVPESGTPRKSTSSANMPTQSLSPCVPSTSGFPKSPVRGKKSVEDSPPSPQPGLVPQQPPQEPEPPEDPCSTDMPSACIKSSQFDKACSSETTEKSSDTDRIIRALKLKELMKIERRKDIQMGKRKVGNKEFTGLDRGKMTMRDLIYYLPNTSPMRSSVVQEENQTETIIPPSPKQQIKTAERDDDDDEEEAESENELLVPKVRVAEDGSIILDEESLTVRVQRTSNTKLVENSMFERGSTTTYSSFRALKHVKTWSVRETDLFFLAINMVGTDFSLIGQLLTHRSRAEIKSKFKKEEKVNPWRIDKALRNTRPYDKEFFSYLLEKILAKDKDKRKSVRLIIPKTRKPRKSKGNKASECCVSDDDDDDVFHMDNQKNLEHDGALGVEKENEDLSNLKETDSSVPAKKKRKRTRAVSEDKDKDSSTTEQVKRKKQRKCSKNTKRDAKDGTEAESKLIAQGDTINLNKEDELNKRNTTASKRRSKSSNSGDEKENEKGVKGTKRKQMKKSCKVISDNEEANGEHEASSVMDKDGSTTKKKRKRAEESDLNGDETAKKKKNTKRKKALKSTIEDENATEEGEGASADIQEAEKLNAPVTAEVIDNDPSKTSRRSKKVSPNLATRQKTQSCEPKASADVERESQDANIPESTLMAADSPVEDERLQMQAVVVLEKTPPRQQKLLSPSKDKCKTDDLEPSGSSPASSYSSEGSSGSSRMQRAGKVKRDLSNGGKKGQGMLDQDETDIVSPVVLLERLTQEPEDEADDLSLNENLTDLSCLRDLNSPMFQRRPMVVLSREEVDKILDASDQSADEEPSVSPLDLSLNTELSFPLHCSKILDDDDHDDDEEAEVDCVFEEHEERTNEMASSEERNCGELEQAESVSAEPDISNLKDISASLKPEVCSHPKVPLSNITPSSPIEEVEPEGQPMTCQDVTTVATVVEGSPTLDIQDNLDPVSTNPDAPTSQETVTAETTLFDTSLGVSDIMEKSENSIPPILVKESAQAASEITEESKLTLTGSLLESQRSQEATPEVNAELKRSLEGPLHTLESLQGSSECKEDTQESANSEINTSTQDVTRIQEVKVDSQEEVSVSSSASVSSEHGIQLTRRSRFLKPKPNLSQKSRPTALQNQKRDPKTHSTQKPKSSETEVSKETLLSNPANDQHGALEDLSNQNRTAEEETSLSKTMNQMESESTKDLGDGSTAVPDKKAITSLSASAVEPPMASQSSRRTCDIDWITPCSSQTTHQALQSEESTGTENKVIPSEDVCAPAEILHLNDDGHNDEEPTFILTLYEIPVTQSHLTSSSNDYEMISDLATVETQAFLGFSDQAHVLPCTSESSRIDSPLVEDSGTEVRISEDLSENGKEKISAQATSHVIRSPHAKSEDCDATSSLEMYIPPTDPDLGCKKGPEFSPLDLTSAIRVSNRITTSPQDSDDSKQHEDASHIFLGDVFVPVSEETRDDSNKNRTMAVESKLQSKDTFSANVTEDLAANVSEQASSHEPILLDTKDEQSDACANQETDAPHTDGESEREKGSDLAPLEDLASQTQSTFSGFNISKSITTLSQDSEDKQQYKGVSHMVLADIFVPVSGEMGDNSSKKASSSRVTDNLAENVEEKISALMTAPEPILLDTKDEEESDNFANTETDISHLDPNSEWKEGSKIAPLEDSLSRNQNKPFGFSVSKCVETLPQNRDNTEQFEHVSHMLLTDVFVPVSEDTGDDSNKDRTMIIEEKRHSREPSTVSVPQRQDTPYGELTKDSTEESKDTPGSSEEQKAPARRRVRQFKPQPKLVKRTRAKDDASKTDQLIMEPRPSCSLHVFLPVYHEENLAGISNTTDEKPVGTMSSIKEHQTCVDGGSMEEEPKSITEEPPIMSQDDLDIMESKSISTLLHESEDFKLEEESNENLTGETAVKDVLESSAEAKELSIPANVQPCCEDMVSDSSAVDSEETMAGTQGVCHMVLPDVFVLVSDEMEGDLGEDRTESIESCPQRDSLSKKSSTHFQKELSREAEDLSQTLVEKSTQNESALVDIKTPVRKRGKQEVKTTLARTDSTLSQSTSSQATTPSHQLTTLAQNENIVLLEEKLKRRLHIMPCTVRLSSLDTVGQSISSPRLEDRKSNDQRSSPTCHASVTNLSEESNTPALSEKKLQEAESEETFSTRSKGKKNESSPDKTCGHLKPVQMLAQTRQRTITDWLKKKSHQTATKQEGEKGPETSSQVQSCLKVKGMHEATVEKTRDSEELEGSHLALALEETEEVSRVSKEVKMSSEVVTKSNDVSQAKKSPTRRRAKLQVKPKLLKRACASERDTSTPNSPQPTPFTSPTRQHARAAREKEESNNKNEQPVKELSNTSSVEENSKRRERSLTSGPQSPISQDTLPRVVLPRVKLWTTEAGISSPSSTPTSSPARVSQSVSPPQLKKSPTQSRSPTDSENPDDDPSRVSQFFLSDIFTEVEEAE